MKTTSAKAYLSNYYTKMDAENIAICRFLRFIPASGKTMLDYGCGASIMASATLSDHHDELHYTDADMRLALEMMRFKYGFPSFNWTPVLSYLSVDINKLRHQIRNIYYSKFPVDLPIRYNTVLCFFCLDMAAQNWLEFNAFYKSLMDVVEPGGWLIIGLVTNRYGNVPGENKYNCLNIKRDDFLRYHKPDILQTIPSCADRGYAGMLFSAEQNPILYG